MTPVTVWDQSKAVAQISAAAKANFLVKVFIVNLVV
jgi:hypothetical protein